MLTVTKVAGLPDGGKVAAWKSREARREGLVAGTIRLEVCAIGHGR